MNKYKHIFIGIIIGALLMTSVTSFAKIKSIEVQDDIKVSINGKVLEMDVPGVIWGGRTLVPVRFVSEELAKLFNTQIDLKFNELTNTVELNTSVTDSVYSIPTPMPTIAPSITPAPEPPMPQDGIPEGMKKISYKIKYDRSIMALEYNGNRYIGSSIIGEYYVSQKLENNKVVFYHDKSNNFSKITELDLSDIRNIIVLKDVGQYKITQYFINENFVSEMLNINLK